MRLLLATAPEPRQRPRLAAAGLARPEGARLSSAAKRGAERSPRQQGGSHHEALRRRRPARRRLRRAGARRGLQDHGARRARRRLGPDGADHADGAPGRGHLRQRPGDERPRRRRHHRARAVRQPGEGRSRGADRRRLRDGRGDPDQRLARRPDDGDADRAADRRVRGDRRAGGERHPDDGRPRRQAEGRPGVGLVGRRLGGRHRPHHRRADRQGGRASIRPRSTTSPSPAAARRSPRSSATR